MELGDDAIGLIEVSATTRRRSPTREFGARRVGGRRDVGHRAWRAIATIGTRSRSCAVVRRGRARRSGFLARLERDTRRRVGSQFVRGRSSPAAGTSCAGDGDHRVRRAASTASVALPVRVSSTGSRPRAVRRGDDRGAARCRAARAVGPSPAVGASSVSVAGTVRTRIESTSVTSAASVSPRVKWVIVPGGGCGHQPLRHKTSTKS